MELNSKDEMNVIHYVESLPIFSMENTLDGKDWLIKTKLNKRLFLQVLFVIFLAG